MQKEMPLLGNVGFEIKKLPADVVGQCTNWRQAVELCMDSSVVPYTREQWAEKLETTPGNLSLILRRSGQRKRYLDPALFTLIQQIAGNEAINQFFDMELRGQLSCQSRKSRIEQLKHEAERLEAEEQAEQQYGA